MKYTCTYILLLESFPLRDDYPFINISRLRNRNELYTNTTRRHTHAHTQNVSAICHVSLVTSVYTHVRTSLFRTGLAGHNL